MFFELRWGEVAESGVAADRVVEGFDVFEDLAGQFAPRRQECRRMSSFFRVAKKLSATALS